MHDCRDWHLGNSQRTVKEDNDKRQRHLNEQGEFLPRHPDVSTRYFQLILPYLTCETQLNNPTFLDPLYELVALHPEHFLPTPAALTCYDPPQPTYKMYVPSPDRRLRESPGDIICAPFPPFSGPDRQPGLRLNPFLVILNAANVFHWYHQLESPSKRGLPPLPDDVMELMKQTTELSELIYWEPQIEPGSYAEIVELTSRNFSV